jgi:hypothetical protein
LCAASSRLDDAMRTIRHRIIEESVMARITTNGALFAVALAIAAPGAAQSIVSAEDPGEIAAVIQKLGFQAKLEKDGVGDPVIRSSAGGVEFTIYFYDCTNNRRCKSLHFTAGYDLPDGTTLAAVQQWNADKRFASAYLDDENDPFLQMDINTDGGVTEQNFESSFELWQSLKGEFENHIGFHDSPQRVSSADSRDTGV